MPHNIRKLLLDIIISCKEITEFTSEKTFSDFMDDRMLQLAIEREFEIIGEALSRMARIDEERLAVNIPVYRRIISFRNIIAHGYDVVDIAAIWDFAINHVPDLLDKA